MQWVFPLVKKRKEKRKKNRWNLFRRVRTPYLLYGHRGRVSGKRVSRIEE